MRQLTHQWKLAKLRGHPYILALHKKLISPKPECISTINPLLLWHIPRVGWALTSPGVEWHPVKSLPVQAAARSSNVLDFGLLVAVEARGVPLCPINFQYSSCLVKLFATAWLYSVMLKKVMCETSRMWPSGILLGDEPCSTTMSC